MGYPHVFNCSWEIKAVQYKQDCMHSEGPMPPPTPPQCFLYLREPKSWRCEEGEQEEEEGGGEGGEEKVCLKTYTNTRSVDKNYLC